MLEAPIPDDEHDRLAALVRLRILDTPPEADLDRITAAVAQVMGVPIALISLIDGHRQWFKSRYGLDAPETPRSISFCGHAVASGEPLIVADAAVDPRFRDNPLVASAPHIRFYAGVPLHSPEGHCIGTLCVIDREPRTLTDGELATLQTLGECLESHLQIRARLLWIEESADVSQGAFGMAIHDLKNPLTGLLAGTQLLRGRHEDEELIEDMVEAGRQMQSILLDILDVLILPTGRVISRSTVSARDIVDASARAVRRTAESRGRTVTWQVDEGIPKLRADREALVRMLVNLITNAIQHAPRGTTVRVQATYADGIVAFAVEDDGDGVPVAVRNKVFEPFFRAGSEQRNGHGLGLASCAHAARSHGGTVAVEDSPTGARFVARIPLTSG